MAAPRSGKKDRVTVVHQWMTLVGVPAGLALLGWFALQFDDLRFNVHDLKRDSGFLWQELGKHTTQLGDIQKSLNEKTR